MEIFEGLSFWEGGGSYRNENWEMPLGFGDNYKVIVCGSRSIFQGSDFGDCK